MQIQYEKITPIQDRILIQVINLLEGDSNENNSKLRGIATKKMLEQPVEPFEVTQAMNNCGTVCAAALDCRWVNTNDIVFFGKYAGTEIMIESERHIMIRESDVLFVLSK